LGYEVPAGRRDGRISQVSETFTNLPPPTINVDRLTQAFAKKGFTQEEMVTLTGKNLNSIYNQLIQYPLDLFDIKLLMKF
jgi:hypothetical protein